jgi:hypothetical protein
MCARSSGFVGYRASASTTTSVRSSPAATASRSSGIRASRTLRPLWLPRAFVHAGDSARKGLGRSGRALPQEGLLARTPLRRAQRAVQRLARADVQPAHACDWPLPRPGAAGRGAAALRTLPPLRFDWSGHRSTPLPIDGYLRHDRCFYRAPERLMHERVELRFDRETARAAAN